MRAKWVWRASGALMAAVILIAPGAAFGQDVISEVIVIYGGSSGIQPPAGYTKINVDLNRNAGGDYIYVCYKKGVGAPITGLYVTTGYHPAVNDHCEIIPVDLNRHAGGAYLYLWTTKDPKCSGVEDIIVILGKNANPPAGYTKINVDLNDGAGGDYIYLCYRMK